MTLGNSYLGSLALSLPVCRTEPQMVSLDEDGPPVGPEGAAVSSHLCLGQTHLPWFPAVPFFGTVPQASLSCGRIWLCLWQRFPQGLGFRKYPKSPTSLLERTSTFLLTMALQTPEPHAASPYFPRTQKLHTGKYLHGRFSANQEGDARTPTHGPVVSVHIYFRGSVRPCKAL